MKKNKKLFAILTLVAFMMTLMPVMAFAADAPNMTITAENGKIIITITGLKPNSSATVSINVPEELENDLVVTQITTTSQIQAASLRTLVTKDTVVTADATGTAKLQVVAPEEVLDEISDVEVAGETPTSGGETVTTKANPTELKAATDDAKKQITESKSDSVVPGVSARASIVATNEANVKVERNRDAQTASIKKDDAQTVALDIVLKDIKGSTLTQAAMNGGTQTVYIWVEENGLANQASDALVLGAASLSDGVTDVGQLPNNVWRVDVTKPVTTVYAQFLRANAGYTVKATLDDRIKVASTTQTFGAITKLAGQANKSTIVVENESVSTRDWSIGIDYYDGRGNKLGDVVTGAEGPVDASGNKTAIDGNKVGTVVVLSDTVATTKVELQVFGSYKAGDPAVHYLGPEVANYPINLSTNSANIELDQTTVTTDYNGKATFNVAGLREGDYKIYVTMGDYESQILVKVKATAANQITTIKFPSNPIATDTEAEDYKNIFRFRLTDANGNIVTGPTPNGATKACVENSDTEQAKYVSLIKAPEANKVQNSDIYLKFVKDKEYYTIGFKGNVKNFSAEGSYEVRIVLDNGNSVTVPFEVKKFDKAVSLHIEYPTEAVELNAQTDVPDIYFLDANNVMKKANNRVTVAATGYAVAEVNYKGEVGVIRVKNDEKYLGSTITVSAVAEKENLVATTTLTVTDSAQSIKLDTNRGQVNVSNRVGFKLVNSNGQAVALGNDTTIDDVTCIVSNVADPDAKVSFSVAGSTRGDLLTNGTGTIVLSSNKETTATVQIMIKATKKTDDVNVNDKEQNNNTGLSTTYYTGIETFTFGAEADKSVVMTIGSKEIVANNVPTAIDVAPFIRDNRTFVPFRALVEAFGAEVAYDEATSTVTTKLDGKTVVMTVGSTVLTVNDETVTMDVAPYIVDDRVVVPVRFVGEAFGFTVEATQDADTGATASVVFYQK